MKLLRGILLLGFCVLMATSAQAATTGSDKTWNGSTGDGLWSTSDNWDPAGIPQSDDSIHITGGSGETVQYDYEYPEGTKFNSLDIDNGNELLMNSGYNLETLTTQLIGDIGYGTLTQSAGTNIVGTELTIGGSAIGNGTYDLQGGGLVVNTAMNVGSWGQGSVTHAAGATAEISNTLILGNSTTGFGEYYLSGDLTVHGTEYIGLAGMGYFYQDAGIHQVDYLTLGTYRYLDTEPESVSHGEYNLFNDGILNVGNEFVGWDGDALFIQNGGEHNVTEDLRIGGGHDGAEEGEGTYNLINGDLVTGSDVSVGFYGTGIFNQLGGKNTVSGWLLVGDYSTSVGTYNLQAGEVKANTEHIGYEGQGTFNQTGGMNTVLNDLTLGGYVSGTGEGHYILNDVIGGVASSLLVRQNLRVSDPGVGIFDQLSGNVDAGGLRVGSLGMYNLHEGNLLNTRATVFTTAMDGIASDPDAVGLALVNAGLIQLVRGSTVWADNEWRLVGTNSEIAQALYGLYPDRGSVTGTSFDAAVGSDNTASLLAALQTQNYINGNGEITDAFRALGNDVSGFNLPGYELQAGSIFAVLHKAAEWTNVMAVIEQTSRGEVVDGVFNQFGGNHNVSGGLTVGELGTGTYNQYGGNLKAQGEIIGGAGTGSFLQTGGNNSTVWGINIGQQEGSTGTYTLQNGDLTVGSSELVGASGHGTFIQQAGNNNVLDILIVGDSATGQGEYDLQDGKLTTVWELVGNEGTGNFVQDSGENNVQEALTVGASGVGTYEQNGGDVNVGTALQVGNNKGGVGIYNLYDGNLRVNLNHTWTETFIGRDGTGTFNQSGGVFDASPGAMYLGNSVGSVGTYNMLSDTATLLAGGIALGEWGGSGYFNQEAGTVRTNSLELARQPDSYGEYNLGPFGSLQVNGFEGIGNLGRGVFTQSGVDTDHHIGGDLALGEFARFVPERALVTPGQFSGIDFDALVDALVATGDMTVTPDGKYQVNGQFTWISDVVMAQLGLSQGQRSSVSDILSNAVFNAIIYGDGIYNLNSGNLFVNGNERIGMVGNGQFNQSGGTHYVSGSMSLGGQAWITTYEGELGKLTRSRGDEGIGVYNMLSSDATLQVDGSIVVGESGFYSRFNHISGSVTADSLGIGLSTTGGGDYAMGAGAKLAVNYETVGSGGAGILTQGSASQNIVKHDMRLGELAGGDGTVNLYDGSLLDVGGTVDRGAGDTTSGGFLRVGDAGKGTFNQFGGDVSVHGWYDAANSEIETVTVNSQSTYNMSGGTLTAGKMDSGTTTFQSGTILNNGTFNLGSVNTGTQEAPVWQGGGTLANPLLVKGNFVNNGTVNVHGDAVNSGLGVVKFDGTFTNNGAFHSDPSIMSFTDLYIGAAGYINAGVADQFTISGNFINSSTMKDAWFTGNSQLIFSSGVHTFQPSGMSMATGFAEKFAWGDVNFGNGQITLTSLSSDQITALYVGTVSGLMITGNQVDNLFGDVNVYYVAEANADLFKGGDHGVYTFASGKGELIPINTVVTPEPAAMVLYGLGALPMGAYFLRRRRVRM